EAVDLCGQIRFWIYCGAWVLFSNLVIRGRRINRVRQKKRLREEGPIAEQEMPAEERGDERIAEKSMFEEKMEAPAIAKPDATTKHGTASEADSAADTKSVWMKMTGMKRRANAGSRWSGWALCGTDLPLKAQQENRGRQQNRSGEHPGTYNPY